MDVCALRELFAEEMFLIVSDAFVNADFGLLAITDERVLFIGETADDASVDVGLDSIRGAAPVNVGGDSESSDLILVTTDARYRFEAVGTYEWSDELARWIEQYHDGEIPMDRSLALAGASEPNDRQPSIRDGDTGGADQSWPVIPQSGLSSNLSGTGSNLVEALERLGALHRQGLLSDSEFNAAKSRLLNS